MRIPFSITAINSAALIIDLLLFILFIQTNSSDSMLSPLSFPPETYSIKIFDDNAPFCQVEGEPCGFFDISLNGNIHFDWIKSWCRCPATHECLFVEHDLRHKVYKFACMRIVEQQKYLYGNGQSSRSRNRIIVSRSRHGRRRSVK